MISLYKSLKKVGFLGLRYRLNFPTCHSEAFAQAVMVALVLRGFQD